MSYEYIGKNVKRYDGLAHVTGETRYVDDIYVPNTLVVKAFRSPVSKGYVRYIDTTAARRLPGVAGIVTNADVPNPLDDQPVIATSIRYRGEPIAAVAAVDEATALEALARLEVDIEEQVPVLDPIRAMQPGAPKVRPEGNLEKFGDRFSRRIVFGDIEAGFRDADYIIEEEYVHPPFEQAPMEPNACLAVPTADGRLTVYATTQSPHVALQSLYKILHTEPESPKSASWAECQRRRGITRLNDIRVVGGYCGGAFGGKAELQAEPITALLALKTGRPVKWRWTREEDLLYSIYRGAWNIRIKDGVKHDGRIVARQVRSIRDAGAYVGQNPYAVDKHCFSAAGPYFIPNVFVEGFCVYTNKPTAGGMRGFAVAPSTFAVEVQMDRIAFRLGIDPWRLRFINAFRNGDLTPTRRALDSVYLIETMQALAKKAGVNLPTELMTMTSAPREKR